MRTPQLSVHATLHRFVQSVQLECVLCRDLQGGSGTLGLQGSSSSGEAWSAGDTLLQCRLSSPRAEAHLEHDALDSPRRTVAQHGPRVRARHYGHAEHVGVQLEAWPVDTLVLHSQNNRGRLGFRVQLEARQVDTLVLRIPAELREGVLQPCSQRHYAPDRCLTVQTVQNTSHSHIRV